MASRKPKPVEVKPSHSPKPISINSNAAHKPEDYDPDMELTDSGESIEQTLEEARAEDAASATASDSIEVEPATPPRIKLKWTDNMKRVAVGAINDYLQSAGAMPSILDLYEVLKDDEAFIHTAGKVNHKNVPLFSPQSLQVGINSLRKQTAKDIADDLASNGRTDLIPLPSLARVQVDRKKWVTDTRALSQFIANLPALRAMRDRCWPALKAKRRP